MSDKRKIESAIAEKNGNSFTVEEIAAQAGISEKLGNQVFRREQFRCITKVGRAERRGARGPAQVLWQQTKSPSRRVCGNCRSDDYCLIRGDTTAKA